MKYVSTFFAVIVVILVLDVLWLKYVASGVFKIELGDIVLDTPRMVPATVFYIGYAIGVLVFVAIPTASSSWHHALLLGGLFGLMAYGTYDLTNMATLRPWTWKVAGMDMAWGTLVTALSAVAGRKVLTLFA
jgi:uncharacterized membrane protein